MKKFSLFLLAFVLVFTACKKDDEGDDGDATAEFVNKSAETRTALLEEFTGVKCGYCPDGHAIAAEMIAENPGKVIAISIHGGTYSTPYAGDEDLTSPYSEALRTFSNLTGFPSAMVSREDHDGNGAIATGRGSWKSIASTIIPQPAVVNIGIKSEYEGGSAKITVQVYYTADGGGSNLLNVAITENGIQTKQAGTTEDPYTHKHVLRDLVTGQWGKTITTTSTGTLETYEFTYTPKGTEIANNLEVTAYITKADKTKVLNADITKLVNGETN